MTKPALAQSQEDPVEAGTQPELHPKLTNDTLDFRSPEHNKMPSALA